MGECQQPATVVGVCVTASCRCGKRGCSGHTPVASGTPEVTLGVSLQAPCCLMRLRLQGLEELEMLLELCPLLFSPLHGVFPSFPKSAPPLALSSWVQKPCPEWRGAGFPDCPASAALQVCEQGLGTVPVPQGVRAVGVVLCSSAVLSHKPTAFPESFLEPHQGKRIPVTRDSFSSPFWLLYQITMDWVACKPRN